MSIWWLPKQKYCCMCVQNLRVASLVICGLTILVAAPDLGVRFAPWCSDLYVGYATIVYACSICGILYFIWLVLVITAAILYMYGIHKKNPITATAFIYASMGSITNRIAFYTAALVRLKTVKHQCGITEKKLYTDGDVNMTLLYNLLFMISVVIAPIWMYFIFVINTYALQMEVENAANVTATPSQPYTQTRLLNIGLPRRLPR